VVAPGVAPAIRLAQVGKYYGGSVKALDGIDCDIQDCEFVSILGPSGCGKSTLVRIVAGLLPCEEGAVTIRGEQVTAPRTDVGVVFQTHNLLPWLTVEANLRLGLEIRHGKEAARKADVQPMLATLGLTGFARAYPHQLSGGMRQRVAIGQALLLGPEVLLMDEPFGALDALTRDHLNMELLRIWQRDRKTVILITHSIAEAVLLSDRVLVVSERPGRITHDVRIELPRPRDPTATRADPAFADYLLQLGKLMGVH
jgi:NitT/TauT family transport system ATP-binding protein